MQEHASLAGPKDPHVLAAAAVGESQFLLTLDCRHLLACVPDVEERGSRPHPQAGRLHPTGLSLHADFRQH
jgi:hypothetical protein